MKKLILISTLVLNAILQFSCSSTKNVSSPTSTINFTEIKSGENSDYTEFTTVEIRSFKELTAVWVRLFSKYDRKPPLPNIDYENNMLIAVILGERNNGGYSIKTKSILETKRNISITTEEEKPGNTCLTNSVMTYPFQLIEIPKTDKEITFTKTVKVNECGK